MKIFKVLLWLFVLIGAGYKAYQFYIIDSYFWAGSIVALVILAIVHPTEKAIVKQTEEVKDAMGTDRIDKDD